MKKNIKHIIIAICLAVFCMLPGISMAQGGGIVIQGEVTSDFDGETLIGVSVSETDASNRIVSGTSTDINGKYVLRIVNPANKLVFTYLGHKKYETTIGDRRTINVKMQEDSKVLSSVEIVHTKTTGEGGYVIPTREISTAMQTIDSREFEGIQVTSLDDALQGRIAGLDIVANSSDPGTATSMRIRGITSINGDSEPLIVLNGIPFSVEIDPNFDYANSNNEQYANMLSINVDDIEEITVLKDAASTAIWGSKGANGVIQITTKKGITGPTRVDYTYRFTHTKQPKGRNMLTGDDYTMYIKEAYLNPNQDDQANDIPEINYDPNFPEYQDYNNNTDWRNAVIQTGKIHDHYVTLSGGGDRALYRISGGYYTQDGTIIGQELNRFSTRANLEYGVSDRIRFISELSLTQTDNKMSYTDDNNKSSLLDIAYRKMPNVTIFDQDRNGNNTDIYYNIPSSSGLHDDQKNLKNPVALAKLASNRSQNTRINPTFRLMYDIFDPMQHYLQLNFMVSFDINNDKVTKFLPAAASNAAWTDGSVNRAEDSDTESLQIYTDNSIAWRPNLSNPDHSLLLYASLQATTGSSASQRLVTSGLPTGGTTDASDMGYLEVASNSRSSWRNLAIMGRMHYSYKSRYIFDGNIRREGSTRFGKGNKWGNFPGVSLKWIISDEEFMKPANKVVSMLALRPSWGISGNQPRYEYLHFSRYATYGTYIDMNAIRPNSLRLSDLKWETSTQYNFGLEIGLFDDTYMFDLNYYTKRIKDLLFENVALSSISGYSSLSYINGGTMDNEGWEIIFNANRFIKYKDFSMDFNMNLSNTKNTIVKLDDTLLESYNADFDYNNGNYLTRIQEGNSFGSIYGFRYKGVYKYDTYEAAIANEGSLVDANGKLLAPFAVDANGNAITDENGNPKPLYYSYNNGATRYQFRGGDAIYEDINNDGSIDELDIVYLGNANPKINGGFGPTFRWKDLSLKFFFNFRYGNKVVNRARMNAENMYYDNNQSTAVNWRWRKDGDETDMPRALYRAGYNWLGSDRYVEDGSFLRLKHITFNYSVPRKFLNNYGISRLSVYFTMNNVYCWSKYSGVDPEVGYGNLVDNKGISYDDSSTPRTRDFTVGVSIGF